MKKFFLLLILIPVIGFGQTQFSNGYNAGFKKGYCLADITCLPPLPSIPPIPEIGEDSNSYSDGYARGIVDGKSYKSSNSAKLPTVTPDYSKNSDKLIEGAYTSAPKYQNPVSDEAAQAIGEGIVNLIMIRKANKIKKRKENLIELPKLYQNFPNLITAFEIANTFNELIKNEYEIETQKDLEDAKIEVYDKYGNFKELFDLETINILEKYDYDWQKFKKENKKIAKSESNKLKDYLKNNKKNKKLESKKIIKL